MRTITLWRAHNSVLSLSPKPQSKPLLSPCCLLSLQPRNGFSRSPYASISSRHCSQWGANTCQQKLGRFVRTSNSEDYVEPIRLLGSEDCGESTESIQITEDCVILRNGITKRELRKESENVLNFLFSDHTIGRYLKLMTIFGCVTLHGSHPALAASDFSVPYLQDLGDISTGFASAFLLIFFSELGDKTFFIAAILAARNSAAVIFAGTFGALAVMSVISVALGRTFHYVDEILPFSFGGNDLPLDDIAAVLLLVYFGVSTLLDASSGDGQKAEEEQKEAELAVSEFSGNGAGVVAAANTVISTFFLVFVAEWGDKSFFSTIALSAASSPLGVIAGALAGHGVATLLAVLGGSLLGSFLSEKVIAYVGGVLFLVFAAITLVEIIN